MPRRPAVALVSVSILSGVALAFAPSCATPKDSGADLGPDGGDGDGTVPLDGGPGTDGPGGGDGGGFDVKDKGTPTALTVNPPTSTLLVNDPSKPPSLTLAARFVYADGTTAPAGSASWTGDRPDVVTIGGGSGAVTATGKLGGKVAVTAAVGALKGTATVEVDLQLVVDPAGSVPAADKTALAAATDADPAIASIVYPYDKTVFPKGLLGPEVMWNGGAPGDEYLLSIKGPYTSIALYALANPPSALPIDTALWNTLTTSVTSGGVAADVVVELRHMTSGGKAHLAAKQTWHIADANLRGTIYYWAVDRGQIEKIKPGAAAPVDAFDSGAVGALGTPAPLDSTTAPSPPWQDNGGGKRCVACHAVSKDGSRLTGTFSTPRGSTGPAGFVDLKTSSITAVGDYLQNVMFSALTPDGAKSVANTVDMKLHLLDAATGAAVGSALDAMSNANDPVFSNDDKLFAFAGNVTGGNPVEFTKSDLQVMDYDGSAGFSGLRTIVPATGPGDAIAFPSFSPDSQWIFFQRGDYSRAKYGNCTPADGYVGCLHGHDELYVVAATPGAAPIALDAANGKGIVLGDNAHLNYQPTVNPIAEGGYFWVVFVSPRDYGNKMVSPQKAAPSDATYSNRKQLWVAAVDATMKGPDPSHPAFRLPGQALETVNMNGYWTLEPCIATPKDGSVASCSAGFECCSGFCRDVGGKPSCVDPPGGCHNLGEKCATDADCCGGGVCVGGFCGKKGPA